MAKINTVTIRERGTGFQATANWKGVRLRPQFESHDDAVVWAKEQESRMAQGLQIEPPSGTRSRSSGRAMTLDQLLDHTKKHRWLVNGPNGGPMASAKSRIIEAEQAIKAVGGGKVRVSTLDYLTIENALTRAQEEQGCAVGTTNRRKSALMVMLKYAVKLGVVAQLPLIERKPETYRRSFRLTPALEQELLTWALAENMAFYDYLVLSLYLGARRGQVLRVRLGESTAHPLDGYVEDDVVIFPPGTADNKATQITVVPMRPIVQEVIQRHRAAGAASNTRILEGCTGRWATYWFGKAKATLLDHADVISQRREGLSVGKDFTPHIARHEFCSRLGDEGFDLHEIQRFSGHATPQMCARYVKPNKVAARRRAMRVPGAMIDEGLPGGELPEFAPTQPIRLIKSNADVATAAAPADPMAALMSALEQHGIAHLLHEVIAAQQAKQA